MDDTHNQTCAITQVPILEGEPVVAVILIAQTNHYVQRLQGMGIRSATVTGYRRPETVWAPVCTPLHGVYDGKGGIGHVVGKFEWASQLRFWQREFGVDTRNLLTVADLVGRIADTPQAPQVGVMFIQHTVWNTVMCEARKIIWWNKPLIERAIAEIASGGFGGEFSLKWQSRIAGLNYTLPDAHTPTGQASLKEAMWLYVSMLELRKLYTPQAGRDTNFGIDLTRVALRAGIEVCNRQARTRGDDIPDEDND